MSYLVLGGRCRACGVVIPWRYPLVEALAVALGLLVLWHFGPTWAALRAFLLCLAMVACAFTDLETRRIPDRITLPGVIGACILAPEDLGRGGVGAVIGALVFALFAMARGRGAPPPAVDGEDEVDPAERRRLDVYWAAAWGAVVGRQLAVVHLPTLTAPDWPLTFRVLSQVDAVVAGCIITGGLFFLVAWGSHAALGRTGLGGGDIKLAGLIGAVLGVGGGLVAAFVGIMLGVYGGHSARLGPPALRRVPRLRAIPGGRRYRGGRLGAAHPGVVPWLSASGPGPPSGAASSNRAAASGRSSCSPSSWRGCSPCCS